MQKIFLGRTRVAECDEHGHNDCCTEEYPCAEGENLKISNHILLLFFHRTDLRGVSLSSLYLATLSM